MLKKLILVVILLLASCEKPEKTYRVFILWSGLGEYAWAKRLEKAGQNLGWECEVCCNAQTLDHYNKMVVDRLLEPHEIQKKIAAFNPDFTISLKEDRIYTTQCPNYLAISGTIPGYFDRHFRPNPKMLAFDGFLHAEHAVESLKTYREKFNRPFYGIDWFPSATSAPYEPTPFRHIFFCGFQWDKKRNSLEFQKVFKNLDSQGILDIYGPADRWGFVPGAVKGFTFDEHVFRQGMRDAGIVLVIHADSNMILGTPAARVFEAASASAVIISDRHAFVIREFGDSVLYVDPSLGGDQLFQQIYDHYIWIRSHPKEAQAMAKKAHAIFAEKYTLEKQLKQLAQMHEKILKDRKS